MHDGAPDGGARRAPGVLGPTVAAAAMVAHFVVGKATRDALFLSHFSVELVPRAMVGATALSALSAVASSRLLARLAPERVVAAAFAASGAMLAALWALGRHDGRLTALVVYAHTAAFGATLGAMFWSLVADAFDPHAARQCAGRIAAGATFGGVAGGLVAWLLPARLGVAAMLLVMAGLHGVAAACVRGLRPRPARAGGEGDGAGPGWRALAGDGYLRSLGLFVLLAAVVQALLDYVLLSHAAPAYGRGPALLSFFAAYQTGIGVLSLALQAAAGRPALERLGLAGTLALLPCAVGGAGALYAFAPALWTAALLRGVDGTLRASLFRPAYEVLYTPLAPAVRRRAKALIDVGADRAGSALGGALVALLLAAAPARPSAALAAAALLASAGLLAATRRLRRGYVASLESSLLRGAVRAEGLELADRATRDTLSRTFGPMSVAAGRDEPGDAGPRSLRFAPDDGSLSMLGTSAFGLHVPGVLDLPAAPAAGRGEGRPLDPAVAATADLRSGQPERVRAALGPAYAQLHPLLAPHLLDLLARDAYAAEAFAALEAAGPRITGLLVDALTDPARPRATRRRVARVLGRAPSQRAADGLALGLRDARFDVRFACGRALAALAERAPEIALPAAAALEAAAAELRLAGPAHDRDGGGDDDDEPEAGAARVARERVGRGLEHVFTLLSLCLPREPLHVAFRALATGDEHLRGTALEYLHTILPAEVRDELWPRLTDRRPAGRDAGTREQLADSLLRSRDAIAAKLGELAGAPPRGRA